MKKLIIATNATENGYEAPRYTNQALYNILEIFELNTKNECWDEDSLHDEVVINEIYIRETM